MSRPVIQLSWNSTEKLLMAVASLLCFLAIYFPLSAFNTLPEIIPTHFDLGGNADAFGPKTSILILPSICLVLHIFLSWLSQYPHWHNYLVEITTDNAERMYRQSRQLLLVVVLLTNALLAYLSWEMIACVNQSEPQINPFAVVIYLPVLMAYLAYALIKMSRN